LIIAAFFLFFAKEACWVWYASPGIAGHQIVYHSAHKDFKISLTEQTGSNMKTIDNNNVKDTGQPFYHGTKADLKPGDLIQPGFRSNYGTRKQAKYVYLTATLDAAIWGAELAQGDGQGRIYIVEPTGSFEDDPNLTDKKFPGNPTKSYRTQHAIKVVGEVKEWQGHSQEQLDAMKNHLEKLKEQGIEAIED
jgi:hypothetical protein